MIDVKRRTRVNTQYFVSTHFNLTCAKFSAHAVDRLAELASEPRVLDLETLGGKFKKKLICHTVAKFTANRNAALASSVLVVVVLIETSQIHRVLSMKAKTVFVRLRGKAQFWKYLPASDWLIPRNDSS